MYKRISTAEKKRQLEEAGIDWPICDCCNLPKKWESSNRQVSGGYWRLRCTRNKANKRQYDTIGSYRYIDRLISTTERRMQKYIPGTSEYDEYFKRRLND